MTEKEFRARIEEVYAIIRARANDFGRDTTNRLAYENCQMLLEYAFENNYECIAQYAER